MKKTTIHRVNGVAKKAREEEGSGLPVKVLVVSQTGKKGSFYSLRRKKQRKAGRPRKDLCNIQEAGKRKARERSTARRKTRSAALRERGDGNTQASHSWKAMVYLL